MANIYLHGIGGAGINIVSETFIKHGDKKEIGMSKLIPNFLDTSDANITAIRKANGKLFKVQSTKASVEEIAGSGSERATNVNDAKVFVKKYLDDINVTKDNPSDIHVVIFSGSGGSGSSVGLLLLRELIMKDCAVCTIVVGDNDNQLYATNTTKTLESLQGMSKVLDKILTVYHVNNSFAEGNYNDRVTAVNSIVRGFIYALMTITADTNKELDKADVRALFKQSNFKTINIPKGVSFIEVFSRQVEANDECSLTLVRTITDTMDNLPEQTNALHEKVGLITNEHMLSEVKDILPISFATKSGCMTGILQHQNEVIEKFRVAASQLAQDDIDVSCDDETGLVF